MLNNKSHCVTLDPLSRDKTMPVKIYGVEIKIYVTYFSKPCEIKLYNSFYS
jgi:hypothetical protein